jgi:flagellar motor switch protein FliN/FliY
MTVDSIDERRNLAFCGDFFDAVAEAMSKASGSTWLVTGIDDAKPKTTETESVLVDIAVAGSRQGSFQLEISKVQASVLASRILGEPIGEFADKAQEALLDTFRAAGDAFVPAQAKELGAFTLKVARASTPLVEVARTMEASFADDEGSRIAMQMHTSIALAQSISQTSDEDLKETIEHPSVPTEARSESEGQEQVNLDLVMDVELNVTLRFGKRQLTLREVLELTSGSVVELDRQVEEPVELLLDGKVIARGEAVVIDGNYGLRVTEVPQAIYPAVQRAHRQ